MWRNVVGNSRAIAATEVTEPAASLQGFIRRRLAV